MAPALRSLIHGLDVFRRHVRVGQAARTEDKLPRPGEVTHQLCTQPQRTDVNSSLDLPQVFDQIRQCLVGHLAVQSFGHQ